MSDEKHFTPSNSYIECTGCECGISNLISTTSKVFVKKQPMATVKDNLPTSFKPFPSCSFSINGTCVPNPVGNWETQDVLEKIDAQKQTPIIEGNRIKCMSTSGTLGTITISEKTDTPPPPENIVDKAQNKINSAANYVTEKITAVTKAASNAIGGIADAAKSAGGFLNNESVQGAIAGASDLVDNIDRKKAEIDVTVANINIRLNNLKKELTQLITGEQQQLQDLMSIQGKKATAASEAEAQEIAYNQDFFNQANTESVSALMNQMQGNLNTFNDSAARLNSGKDYTIEVNKGSGESTRLFSGTANTITPATNTSPTLPSTSDIIQESIKNNDPEGLQAATDRYNETNAILEEHGVTLGNPEDKQETIQSLVLLDNITEVIEGSNDLSGLTNNIIPYQNTVINIGSNIANEHINNAINEERQELNTKVQGEIDELLKEIGYLEKMQEYQEESAELQEDLDRAAAALGIAGDFGAFVDGIAAEYLGELADKYEQVMNQLGENMSRLNSALDGAKYIAGGMRAGDVITHAPDLEDEEEEEEEPITELPPPPPPEEEEEEEEPEEEETDECSFTKLTVIKNNTLEYVVIEKDEDKVLVNQPINKPITFVAGTRESTKKNFELQIENLKRKEEHKQDQLIYSIDDETNSVDFPDGDLVKIPIDINYNSIFFEGPRLLSKLMGYFGEIPFTKYQIPIDLCGFKKTINLNVYPDAEWGLVLTIESNDPLAQSYASLSPGKVWQAETKKANEIGLMNDRPLTEGKRKATFKVAYYVQYNGGKDKSQIGLPIIERAYKVSKSLFSAVKYVDDLLDKLTREQSLSDGKYRLNAAKIIIIPPVANIGISHKISPPKDTNIFNDKESLFEMDIKFDPFLAAKIELDMVQVAQKVAWIYALIKAIEKLTDKPINQVFKFNIFLNLKVSVGGTITASEQNFSISPGFTLGVELEINLEKKTGFWIWGVTYKATIGANITSGMNVTATVGKDNSGVYGQGALKFSGLVLDGYIKLSVTGGKEEVGDEDFKTIFELNKDWKGEFGGYEKATDKYYFVQND